MTSVIVADVLVSTAMIDATDASTWPNMAPAIRILFIPMFLAVVLVYAACVNPIIRLWVPRTAIDRPRQLFLLGTSYSLVLAALPLKYLLPAHPASVMIGPVLAMGCATLLHRRSALRHREA